MDDLHEVQSTQLEDDLDGPLGCFLVWIFGLPLVVLITWAILEVAS